MEYPCTQCGQCCKQVWKVLESPDVHPAFKELIEQFPYKTKPDGSCEMLTEDNLCSVYDNRPSMCNVKAGAKVLGISEAEWFRVNRDTCNNFIQDAGLDPSFFVVLDDA
jgi:hypothetical protein